jgi:uncharacterized C2H2 Zn-finger protein
MSVSYIAHVHTAKPPWLSEYRSDRGIWRCPRGAVTRTRPSGVRLLADDLEHVDGEDYRRAPRRFADDSRF